MVWLTPVEKSTSEGTGPALIFMKILQAACPHPAFFALTAFFRMNQQAAKHHLSGLELLDWILM
jgi:hypothetical protein